MATLNLSLLGPGTYTFEDDGIPGNGQSVVRDANGAIVQFLGHPPDELTIVSGAGQNLIFNITDSFGAANVTVGNLNNNTETPNSIKVRNLGATTGAVVFVSNGAITELGSDAAPDIIAGTLVLSATSGVGTAANAIETQTGFIEAETNTGGITVTNFGAVRIGAVSSDVAGLDVGTSGDIRFTAFGSIGLADTTGLESVHGGGISGNVTLIANGYDSDIVATVNRDSITAVAGSVILQAGRDVALGTSGANFDNDVSASGHITVTAGRDFIIDGLANVNSTGAGGGVTVSAGRNISVLNSSGAPSPGAGISATGGGNVNVSTGGGGTMTLAGHTSLSSSSGNITVIADRMIFAGQNDAFITAASGTVTLRPATAGWGIHLGSQFDGAAATLELSLGEIDAQNGGIISSALIIGSTEAGPVTITFIQISGSALDHQLTILSGTDIVVRESTPGVGFIISSGHVTLQAGDNVSMSPFDMDIIVNTLTVFVDAPNTDPGFGGTATLDANIRGSGILGTTGASFVNGNGDADTLIGSARANTLNGFAGNDTLRGLGGNDTLNGGTGFDTMIGGLGDDIFIVDNLSDSTDEAVGEGHDQVFTSISYGLGSGQEIEFFSTLNQAGTAAINLTGNAFNQEIVGNNGPNTFIGGGGADRLVGFGGNDIYSVDSNDDTIQDDVGQGFDQVFAAASYTLGAGVEIEYLSALNQAGTTAINLTGNSFSQEIVGNNGVNVLVGGGGTDNMVGFGGNDVYFVDSFDDTVQEAVGGGGFDVVYTSASYMLANGSEVEGLASSDPASTAGINLVGNGLGNLITGNAGANILDGNGGPDVLEGGAGGDILAFSTALGGSNIDTIVDFLSGVDKIALDDAVFTGLAPGSLPAGAFVTGTQAGDADDRIIYNPATGALLFDADGNGAGAAIHFATLQGAPAIVAGDFIVN